MSDSESDGAPPFVTALISVAPAWRPGLRSKELNVEIGRLNGF